MNKRHPANLSKYYDQDQDIIPFYCSSGSHVLVDQDMESCIKKHDCPECLKARLQGIRFKSESYRHRHKRRKQKGYAAPREKYTHSVKWAFTHEHGFDLTSFKKGGFEAVLRKLELPPKGKTPSKKHVWVWENNDLKITTSSNPITGERIQMFGGDVVKKWPDKRRDYAGYINLTSPYSRLLQRAVSVIKKQAEFIKGEVVGGYI